MDGWHDVGICSFLGFCIDRVTFIEYVGEGDLIDG